MAPTSRISSEVDFARDGKQLGFLRLSHSVHRSAYSWIAIPIVVIKNGSGLTAGNHGDEYEGQIALVKLCRELEPESVRGRIIMLTAANCPAAVAGLRTSPIDAMNLNRSFPGDPDGLPTAAIAHFIESELLANADYALDLHSGGSALIYLPSALIVETDDATASGKQHELLEAFNAPPGYIAAGNEDRTLLAAAQRAGVAAMGTELGGSGTTSLHSLSVAERGVRRVLKHVGSVPEMSVDLELQPSRMMQVRNSDYYVYSPDYGIWEPLEEIGDDVELGQPAAAVYCPETPWREPTVTHFGHNGTIICKRVPGAVQRGDCLFHLATDLR